MRSKPCSTTSRVDIRRCLAIVACLLGLPVSAHHNELGRTTTGKVGDALEIAIPVATFAATAWRRDWEGSRQFVTGLLSTLGVTYALKESVSKQRPDGRDDDSFPSSHTAVSVQAAGFIDERYGWRYALPVYAVAAWVGYSRVYDDRHDEQDVIAGALIGFAAARLFTTSYKGVEMVPELSHDYVGLRFHYSPVTASLQSRR